jgi:hypothetical protein
VIFPENSRSSQAMLSQYLTFLPHKFPRPKKIRKNFHALNQPTDPQFSRHFEHQRKFQEKKKTPQKFKSENLFAIFSLTFFPPAFLICYFKREINRLVRSMARE